jgi:hypothetical protein
MHFSGRKNMFSLTTHPGTFIIEVEAEMFLSKSCTISEYCGGNREMATDDPTADVVVDISSDWSASTELLLPETQAKTVKK